jgi:hypothetical protein
MDRLGGIRRGKRRVEDLRAVVATAHPNVRRRTSTHQRDATATVVAPAVVPGIVIVRGERRLEGVEELVPGEGVGLAFRVDLDLNGGCFKPNVVNADAERVEPDGVGLEARNDEDSPCALTGRR